MPNEPIHFLGAGISGAALGFGTTRLMNIASTVERVALLEHAFDLGIRHFDTAPYYGYGEAERVVGRFIRSRRDRVTVTTKFGIQPPRVAGLATMAGMAKRMTRGMAPLRRLLSRQAGKLIRRGAFSVTDARQSLDASLRALKTDYIDVYLLHDADAADTASDELLAFLDAQVRKGVIRCFGIGSEFEPTLGVITQHPAYARVVQFENNILCRNLDLLPAETDCAVITHRALGAALRELIALLRAAPAVAARWSVDVGANCADESVLSGLMLTYAVRANRAGMVLFSSRSRTHLDGNVGAVTHRQFSDSQLSVFANLVKEDAFQGRN